MPIMLACPPATITSASPYWNGTECLTNGMGSGCTCSYHVEAFSFLSPDWMVNIACGHVAYHEWHQKGIHTAGPLLVKLLYILSMAWRADAGSHAHAYAVKDPPSPYQYRTGSRASLDAATANCENASIRGPPWHPCTVWDQTLYLCGPACTYNRLCQNNTWPIPTVLSLSPCQKLSTSFPMGVMAPMPVTTTLCFHTISLLFFYSPENIQVILPWPFRRLRLIPGL